MSIDPIKATELISNNYQSYLGTTFRFRDPGLQGRFLRNLREKGRFVKGPILEATPAFELGASIKELVKEGILSEKFYHLGDVGLPAERRLYRHQEKAVRKVVAGRRNIVVSTGTGSGKTETFLIPILNHLFREYERGELCPGVRALLLYPMNALANDQLKRLRSLLANCPQITFGRYTGETEKTYRAAREKYYNMFHKDPLPNELISREQMWENPPHILLTNYAMLEYLLLRPEDTVFFDGQHAGQWRFLVIDEAHTYSGAKGIEMALLLRRLKDRVTGGQRGKLQCIATSATLGEGDENRSLIVEFAAQLFDEKFEWVEGDRDRQDVVEAERLPLTQEDEGWGRAEPEVYAKWEKVIGEDLPLEEKISRLYQLGKEAGVPAEVLERARTAGRVKGWQSFLHEALKGDKNLIRLQEELQDGPRILSELVSIVGFSPSEGLKSLVSLVGLANSAREGDAFRPLLPARYHVFVRAIEGVYVTLRPQKSVFLERREKITSEDGEFRVFEAAVCRQCGEMYVVGRLEEIDGVSYLRSVSSEHRKHEYFLVLDQDAELLDYDEDEEVELPEVSSIIIDDKYKNKYLLCHCCGAVEKEGVVQFPCNCSEKYRLKLLRVPSSPEGKVFICPSCGRRSPNGIVLRFVAGTDAAASVLASALYQQIAPPKNGEDSSVPVEEDEWSSGVAADADNTNGNQENNRKLLIFSDSRQDAAFFAPYLNRTYNRILRRRLILQTLLENGRAAVNNSWRLQDLVGPLCQAAQRAGFFDASYSTQQQTDDAWKWIMGEFLSLDRHNSLEGLGLIGFSLVGPPEWIPPAALTGGKWILSCDEVLTLIRILLDGIRLRGAVTFPPHVSPTDEFFQPRNRPLFFRSSGAEPRKGIISWNTDRLNSRLDFLMRLAQKLNTGLSEDDCRIALRNIWDKVLAPEVKSPWKSYFSSHTERGEGTLYRIKHEFWEIKSSLIDSGVQWYICDKCRNLTLHNLRETCPTYRCSGRLRKCDPLEHFKDNHYFQLYLNLEPIKLKAEEHTAQLTSEAAARLQNAFVQGDVNVLSCSTTFELGVDVGELEAVFMRNVPPSAANYIQRAGRAGRRTDSTAYVLTYAQRRSHDMDHYREPMRLVRGRINSPHFSISNRKIALRHLFATALASFWKIHPELFGKVEHFFFSEKDGPKLFKEYLGKKPEKLKVSLLRIVPKDLHNDLKIENWGWVDELFDEKEGVLTQAAYKIVSDVKSLEEIKRGLFEKNKKVDHLTRLIRTLKEKDLIGYLSSNNVIPKYGFPVDVVELQIRSDIVEEAKNLQLERDLKIALSEYAPSSQVVAGGKVWTSRYIRRLPDREWEKFSYAICDYCQNYQSVMAELEEKRKLDVCNVCGSKIDKNRGVFIVPSFGFIASGEKPENPGDEKPEKTYTTRVYFSGKFLGQEKELLVKLSEGIELELAAASRGRLAVINSAANQCFSVCPACGYTVLGNEGLPSTHKTYWGSDCSSRLLKRYSLGHEFETDILKLRFSGYSDMRRAFWYSLLYGLLEGISSALHIERQDLDGCLYPTPGNPLGNYSLIIFDDVPGGAGHVKRLVNEGSFKKVLRVTLERLESCECGGAEGNASCYGCLRHYRNQFCHDELNRGMVIDFLKRVKPI